MRKDYFELAIRNLKSRSLRSWLTIFGIIIGVFLVIFLLSLSQGIKEAILKQLKMMGSDVIMVYPGEPSDFMMAFAGGLELSEEDIREIERTEGVEKVIRQDWKAEVMRCEGKKKSVFLYGIAFSDVSDILISKLGMQTEVGRFPKSGRREIAVGAIVPKDIFPGLRVGAKAYIAGRQFEVVGILKSLGNRNDDSMVALDLGVFQTITGEREGAPFVMATIEPGYHQDDVAERLKENLRQSHKRKRGKDQPAVSVITSEKAMSLVGNVLSIIQLAIFLIAAFAILVGAIGIMNTMYTSTRERTREIGIMKAVGAKNSDISSIFLIESAIMGLAGGVGGTILGAGGAKLIELLLKYSSAFYIEAHISFWLILGGLLITALAGCVSGYLPARRASQLKPVDALRYE